MKNLIVFCLFLCSNFAVSHASQEVLVQGSMKSLQSMIKDVEGFAVEAVKGTPQAAFVQPGSLSFLVPMMMGLPAGLVNMSEGGYLLVLNSDDLKNAPNAMVIPLMGGLKSGSQIKANGDVFEWKTKGKSVYLADAGKGFATLSEKKEHAKAVADFFKTWTAKPKIGSDLISLQVNLSTMIQSHKKEFFEEYEKEVKKVSGKNAKMAKSYLEIFKDGITAIDNFSMSLSVISDQLELKSSVSTFEKGDFADLVRAFSKLKANNGETAYLNSASALFGVFQWDQSINKPMTALMNKLLSPLVGENQEVNKAMELFTQSMDYMNSGMTFSNYLSESGVVSQMVFDVKNGNEYTANLEKLMSATNDFTNEIYKNMEVPMTLSMKVEKEKEQVSGLDVQKISYKTDNPLVGLDDLNQYISNDKDKIYMVTNQTGDKSDLEELINAGRSKQANLSNRSGYKEALSAVADQNMGFVSIYFIDYIKSSIEQLKANAGMMAGMFSSFEGVLQTLPNSKHTINFGYGAPTSQSMSMTLNIPAPAVQEIIMAGLAMQKQFMAAAAKNKTSAASNYMGKPAPKATTTTIDGKSWSLEDQKGKVVLIDFWATWCGPCVRAMPEMKAIYEKYKSHPKFLMVGTAMDRKASDVNNFTSSENIPWLQLHEPGKDWNNSFAGAFGINSIPSIWIIDADGVVRGEKLYGKASIESLLDELLQ